MLRFITRYICNLFLLLGTPVLAENDNPFGITTYGSFLHTDSVPNALFFFNEIEQYDSFELRRALRNHDVDTVVLASDGGSVWEGLNMAGIIHDKGIITYVPELPDNMGCYSACAYMFFGGKIRKAEGILAVHQMGAYGSERDRSEEQVSETQQSTQFTVSEIIGFLNEFETPPWVYEKMFRSRDFYEFNRTEKAKLSSRIDEIRNENLYEINAFVKIFMKQIEKLKEEKKRAPPKVSAEEERRLLISEIQKHLNKAGCNAGIADGIWGRRTQAAAVLFAKTAKLPTSSDKLISEQFVSKLKSAPANFCPKPKPVRVRSFAAYYDVYCNDARMNEIFAVEMINRSAQRFRWSYNDTGSWSTVTWNGSTFYEADSKISGKLSFNKNGFVHSISFANKNCNNISLKAR